MTFETKQDAMDAFEATRAEWLAAARAYARQLGRSGASVTINDIRASGPQLPEGVDPRVCGAVFNTAEWECTGYVRSDRRVSHGRPVAQFRLVA